VKVRSADAGDREHLVALRCALWPDIEPDSHRRAIALRADAPLRHEILVLQESLDRITGFVELSRDAGEPGEGARVRIHGLFVAPPARRRGGARALVAAAERWAHGRGAASLVCELDADSEALACLDRLGFGGARRTVRVERPVSAGIEPVVPVLPDQSAPVAAAGPVAAAEPPGRRVLWLVVNALVLAAAVASFLATDIFSKELVPGVLLPLLDVAFVIYFMFVFVIHRYRRRTDSSARAAELFRTGD
jgi:aminoglycoside 6'-N-acetyltransferase I